MKKRSKSGGENTVAHWEASVSAQLPTKMFKNHVGMMCLNVAVIDKDTDRLRTDLAGSGVGVERRGRAISSPAAQDGQCGVRAVLPPAPPPASPPAHGRHASRPTPATEMLAAKGLVY